MKVDQARVRDLITQTITLMCKNGLEFNCELRIEGLLAVTVDGSDIFVIHMDEKVTDQSSSSSSCAAGSRYTQCQPRQQESCTFTSQQQLDSAAGAVSDVDVADACADRVHGALTSSSSSVVSDHSERRSMLNLKDEQPVDTQPEAEDSDDDVMIVESDVKPSLCSAVSLPFVEGTTEFCGPLSPVNKRRRRTSLLESVCSASGLGMNSQQGSASAYLFSGSAPSNSNLCIPQTLSFSGENDACHHDTAYDLASSCLSTNGSQQIHLLSANGSQALVSNRCWTCLLSGLH